MITPIEIRQHQFKKALRGYDKEEVQSFLTTLSMEWEKVLEEHKRVKTELEKTQSNLDSLKQVESVLHKTLLQAEETSKSTVENAKKDAELKMAEAEGKSRQLIKEAINERSKIEMQINELISRRNEILQQLKSYLVAQTERLKTFEIEEMKRSPIRKATEPEEKPVEREQPKPKKEEEEGSFFESVSSGSDSNIINDIADEL